MGGEGIAVHIAKLPELLRKHSA